LEQKGEKQNREIVSNDAIIMMSITEIIVSII